VRGLDIFRDRFKKYEGAFVLIGGAACDDWFARQGLAFRPTKDLDIVLVVEVVDADFVSALRNFVEDGGYRIRQRTEGSPILCRFESPANDAFPKELELFSRQSEWAGLEGSKRIVPVQIEPEHHSLSAILLDDRYYQLIREHSEKQEGIAFATATALIPLKARAWLDHMARKEAGEEVDSSNIKKHRTDVFALALTLPGEAGPALPESIRDDLRQFLEAFPGASAEWQAILASLKSRFPAVPAPATLREAIQVFFSLS